GQCCDHRSQGTCGASLPSDDLADVLRVDPDLKGAGPAAVGLAHPDVVRVRNQATDQVFQRVGEHAQASSASAGAASASASAAFFFGLEMAAVEGSLSASARA